MEEVGKSRMKMSEVYEIVTAPEAQPIEKTERIVENMPDKPAISFGGSFS